MLSPVLMVVADGSMTLLPDASATLTVGGVVAAPPVMAVPSSARTASSASGSAALARGCIRGELLLRSGSGQRQASRRGRRPSRPRINVPAGRDARTRTFVQPEALVL